MSKLIYSFLYVVAESPHKLDELREMASLWAQTIRGEGRFTGDILLLTNLDIRRSEFGTKIIDMPVQAALNRHTHRILRFREIPFQNYDSIMHIDLDTIAVADVNPMFATDHRLWVAPSNLPTICDFHGKELINPAEHVFWRAVSRRARGLGISACIYSMRSDVFPRVMDRWSRTIHRLSRRAADPLTANLSDQAYLNCVYLRHRIPVRIYGREEIQHRDYKITSKTRLLHFPHPDRVSLMRSYCQF
jgi:hypothetical protein